jgi:hypothetical protein
MRSPWIMMGCIAAFLVTMVASTSSYFADDEAQPAGQATATAPSEAAPLGPDPSAPSAPPGPDDGPGAVPMNVPAALFAGACTADCPDSEAGYQWAEAHRLSDPADCPNDPQPFTEGCRLYVELQTALGGHDDDPPASSE